MTYVYLPVCQMPQHIDSWKLNSSSDSLKIPLQQKFDLPCQFPFLCLSLQQKVPIVPDEYRVDGLATAKGEAWRSMRQILSPAFTASKLRMVIPLS